MLYITGILEIILAYFACPYRPIATYSSYNMATEHNFSAKNQHKHYAIVVKYLMHKLDS